MLGDTCDGLLTRARLLSTETSSRDIRGARQGETRMRQRVAVGQEEQVHEQFRRRPVPEKTAAETRRPRSDQIHRDRPGSGQSDGE